MTYMLFIYLLLSFLGPQGLTGNQLLEVERTYNSAMSAPVHRSGKGDVVEEVGQTSVLLPVTVIEAPKVPKLRTVAARKFAN